MSRRVRSKLDGRLREKCDCGRLIADKEDWDDPKIGEGDRDDLCWGVGTNHEFAWPADTTEGKRPDGWPETCASCGADWTHIGYDHADGFNCRACGRCDSDE